VSGAYKDGVVQSSTGSPKRWYLLHDGGDGGAGEDGFTIKKKRHHSLSITPRFCPGWELLCNHQHRSIASIELWVESWLRYLTLCSTVL
jgi:hypothetical protein